MTWGHLKAPASVNIRSKHPEEHSVTLVKNEDLLRGHGRCSFASCLFFPPLWPLLGNAGCLVHPVLGGGATAPLAPPLIRHCTYVRYVSKISQEKQRTFRWPGLASYSQLCPCRLGLDFRHVWNIKWCLTFNVKTLITPRSFSYRNFPATTDSCNTSETSMCKIQARGRNMPTVPVRYDIPCAYKIFVSPYFTGGGGNPIRRHLYHTRCSTVVLFPPKCWMD